MTFQISEMATKLSDFRMDVKNVINQIIENWCLVKWCDDNPNELISNRLRNHWATELKGYMNFIAGINLKSGKKDKVLKSILIDDLELDYGNSISIIIRKKFDKEGLSKYINKISFECANQINRIINILASNENDVEEYIKGEIG